MIRGHYDPPVLIELPTLSGVRALQPLADANGGMATAEYHYHETRESSGKTLYKLHHIEEWLAPASPREQAERLTDDLFQRVRTLVDDMRARR